MGSASQCGQSGSRTDLIAPLREPGGPFPSSKINYGDSSSDGVIQARHMDSNRSAALKRFEAPAAISQISRQLFGLNKNVRYGGRTKEGRPCLPVPPRSLARDATSRRRIGDIGEKAPLLTFPSFVSFCRGIPFSAGDLKSCRGRMRRIIYNAIPSAREISIKARQP